MEVMIIGGGIGGLTLALSLHRVGIASRVFEAAPQIQAVGVGVSLLPHCTKVLGGLGLNDALADVAVTTTTTSFFNRFGQYVHSEKTGRHAGYEWPQFQVHRGDLQMILLRACQERLGADRIVTGHRCTGFTQGAGSVTAHFADPSGAPLEPHTADALIACDGLHSVVRKQLHPDEGEPVYSGVNMWRGVTRWKPYFDGATYVRGGWLTPGKMVIYPIRKALDENGLQLINWVAEVTTPKYERRDWNRKGRLEDFIDVFDDWHFDWLDVPAMIRAADSLLEFPMVDQDPLPWWTQGRVTLLGDAAHPMVPRGSNGAGQAILDAHAMAEAMAAERDVEQALQRYEAVRRPATTNIVLTNRVMPPDAILKEVYERTNDQPFQLIEDVISHEELMAISDGYKRVAGYDHASLAG
ncbi:3-hydroxybenzoate 6-hydroxylase 1 [Pigmentiphaga humi]|uniref:3-hydroxybenzoate 6-hydroxylase 1 n=1 Tax=Pigmentiphaga humi TaxID=2478468 RepID=A0A3P4B1B4_9BURK|nr:flavin-dependent oxidoreductase [Pigmentiphaga humi]VCU70079.1 3-hydroxybenzoate 6-hydroxylase 1 [Pigmentiphaga humi]